MNERIKALVEQATSYMPGQPPYAGLTFDMFDKEKFAELIVRDVVTTVKRTQVTSPDFEWAILNNYDFGVEE